MSKKLWLALVSHVEVPGTIPALFCQEAEPSDRAIKRRFTDTAKPAELEIECVYNLTHAIANNEDNRKAIEAFIAVFIASKTPKQDSPSTATAA